MLLATFFAIYPFVALFFGLVAAIGVLAFGIAAAVIILLNREDLSEIIPRILGAAVIFSLGCGFALLFVYWTKSALT